MRRTTTTLFTTLLAGLISTSAHAIDLDPGETLQPVPFSISATRSKRLR